MLVEVAETVDKLVGVSGICLVVREAVATPDVPSALSPTKDKVYVVPNAKPVRV